MNQRGSIGQRIAAGMKAFWDKIPMFGKGHAVAWIRSGYKEAAQGLKAFPDSISSTEEPGLFGNPTSYEVSASRNPTNLFDSRVQEARERAQQEFSLDQELTR